MTNFPRAKIVRREAMFGTGQLPILFTRRLWRSNVFESIAIVGATGAVGSLIRQMLEERNFPYSKITFLASERSAGTTITFKGEKHKVELLRPEAFDDIDLAIGSTPDPVAKEFCPWA